MGGERTLYPGRGNGEDWMAISIIQSMLYIKDAFANHVLVGPFEIYEILMRHNREETNPRANLRIGPTGNACVAAISVMVETIGGIVGCLEMVEATAALSAKGMMTEIPSPDYGYVRSSVILRERIGQSLYNDWVDGNLDELTYVDRQGGGTTAQGHSYANSNGVRVDTT